MRTAIQLYTLRSLEEPLPRTLERVAETPLEGVELGAASVADEAVRETLAATGLDLPTLGAGTDTLEDPGGDLRDACEAVGVERVVLGYLPPERFASAEAARETADLVSGYVDALADVGLELCYHNHAHEFTDVGDGRTAFDVFLERADDRLRLELDVGWVGTGGLDPVETLARLGDRTPAIHVKDMRFEEGSFADLGEGDLDLEAVLAAAFEADVEWAVYEHDEPGDPLQALERDSQVLVDAVEAARPGP